jgi:hypothetical protein
MMYLLCMAFGLFVIGAAIAGALVFGSIILMAISLWETIPR